ncbi:hypothetical protein Enr13x_71180 [Stieleria neptunia]|uniref:Response regulatory domain-containing protein n=1 Tax=Stieleria neptunia TaxID=2527979 RepID=A0A518I276_9BACT|nr:hypothetical protein [Stieleria neptunia]QDV47209.1 hypothetical protein Enr13x_71180 [Stieleria neptunia]
MNRFVAVAPTGQAIPFWVCESGRRWSDAAKRFVGPFQHDADTEACGQAVGSGRPTFHVQVFEAAKIRALLAGQSDLVLLWELSAENTSAVALHIAQIGASRPDVMQWAAIDDVSPHQSASLSLRIRELGVSAVLHQPQDLALLARLVRRRFSTPMQTR